LQTVIFVAGRNLTRQHRAKCWYVRDRLPRLLSKTAADLDLAVEALQKISAAQMAELEDIHSEWEFVEV
jgi:hypothetical protein